MWPANELEAGRDAGHHAIHGTSNGFTKHSGVESDLEDPRVRGAVRAEAFHRYGSTRYSGRESVNALPLKVVRLFDVDDAIDENAILLHRLRLRSTDQHACSAVTGTEAELSFKTRIERHVNFTDRSGFRQRERESGRHAR